MACGIILRDAASRTCSLGGETNGRNSIKLGHVEGHVERRGPASHCGR